MSCNENLIFIMPYIITRILNQRAKTNIKFEYQFVSKDLMINITMKQSIGN